MPGRREIYDRHLGLSTIILMIAEIVDEPPYGFIGKPIGH